MAGCEDWVANNKCWGDLVGLPQWKQTDLLLTALVWLCWGCCKLATCWCCGLANNKCWGCRDLGLQVGNLRVLWLDVRTGSKTTNAGDAGILGCMQVGNLQVLWLDVRTGSQKKTCCGCRDLGRNLQVLWLDVRTWLQTTNAEDAGILGCRLATCRCCCGWMQGLGQSASVVAGCED